jgi:hypothetical protein
MDDGGQFIAFSTREGEKVLYNPEPDLPETA